jgi:predicted RNase H-like HicB family nuclease
VAADTIHLVIRAVDGGFYATSPQAPGLAYLRPTLDELRADLDDVLAFHLDRPGPFTVLEHHERHYELGDRELVTRIAFDDHRDEREEAYTRLGRALAVPEQAETLVTGPTNRVGEVLYICVVPSDALHWVAAQLDPRGETATICIAVGDELLLTFRISTGEAGPPESRETVADLMRSQPILQPVTTPVAV